MDVAGVALMAGSARSEGGGAERKRNGWGGRRQSKKETAGAVGCKSGENRRRR